MSSISCDAEEVRVLRAKNDSLENELAKMKSEHLASDFERRRLERKLEVKNGELEDLIKKLGFSKEAEVMADKRYKRALEYNEEVEAEMGDLKWRFLAEREELIGKLSDLKAKLMEKEVELGDLKEQLRGNEHLQISGNLKAAGNQADVKKESPDSNDVSSDDNSCDPSDQEREVEETSFEIIVRILSSKKLIMRIEPFWTVEYLKSKIQDRWGIPWDQQRLVFARKILEHSHTVAHYNIQKQSTIDLVPVLRGRRDHQQEPEQTKFRITVKRLYGKTLIAMFITPFWTIERIKLVIQDKVGIPAHKQELIFEGESLDDSCTVAEYGIKKESVIDLEEYLP